MTLHCVCSSIFESVTVPDSCWLFLRAGRCEEPRLGCLEPRGRPSLQQLHAHGDTMILPAWAIVLLASFPSISLLICTGVLIFNRCSGSPEKVAPAEKGSSSTEGSKAADAADPEAGAPPEAAPPPVEPPAGEEQDDNSAPPPAPPPAAPLADLPPLAASLLLGR